MKFIDCIQGTPEWHAARVGLATASCFSKARSRYAGKAEKVDKKTGEITPAERGLPNAAALDYAAQVALEIVSGEPQDDTYITWQMKRGTALEEEARNLYERRTGNLVLEAGLAVSDCGRYGYSTDGLIGEDGGVEIKCPTSPSKLLALLATLNGEEYLDQIHGGHLITGRSWTDLVIYAPQLSSVGRELTIIRIQRDDTYIKALSSDLAEFIALVDANVAVFKGIKAPVDEPVAA